MKQVHVIISGRVQGVFFRACTQEKAIALGVTGWVKNTQNSTVEALFQGEDSQLEELLQWCQIGPPASSVTDIDTTYEPCEGRFETFSIIT